MPGNHPHIVGKVNLELHFTGGQYDSKLLQKVKELVLEKVDAALNKMPDISDRYFSIDQLDIELDAPDIDIFTNLFEEQLTRVLNEKIKEYPSAAEEDDIMEFSSEERLWQQFLHYLKFGYLPWNSSSNEQLDFKEVLLLFQEQDAGSRIRLLKEALKDDTTADRFCYELPQIYLNQILRTSGEKLSKGFRKLEIIADEMLSVFPEYIRFIKSSREIFMRWIFSVSLKIKNLSNNKEGNIRDEILRIAFRERSAVHVAGRLAIIIETSIKEYLSSDQSEIELAQNSSNHKERLILQALQLHQQGLINLELDKKQKQQLKNIRYPEEISNVKVKINREEKQEEKLLGKNDPDKRIYIDNAGLILLHPYLLPLFQELGFCDHQSFYSVQFQQTAVVVLQKLAGLDTELKTGLALNKILCGMEIREIIPEGIQLEHAWDKEFDNLLKSTIANWKVLKNTSIEGFRISFLQRQGILEITQDSQKLFVEKKPYDVLLERLPWPIGLVKLPWMDRPLWVDW